MDGFSQLRLAIPAGSSEDRHEAKQHAPYSDVTSLFLLTTPPFFSEESKSSLAIETAWSACQVSKFVISNTILTQIH